jgi:hypothetical protein
LLGPFRQESRRVAAKSTKFFDCKGNEPDVGATRVPLRLLHPLPYSDYELGLLSTAFITYEPLLRRIIVTCAELILILHFFLFARSGALCNSSSCHVTDPRVTFSLFVGLPSPLARNFDNNIRSVSFVTRALEIAPSLQSQLRSHHSSISLHPVLLFFGLSCRDTLNHAASDAPTLPVSWHFRVIYKHNARNFDIVCSTPTLDLTLNN